MHLLDHFGNGFVSFVQEDVLPFHLIVAVVQVAHIEVLRIRFRPLYYTTKKPWPYNPKIVGFTKGTLTKASGLFLHYYSTLIDPL